MINKTLSENINAKICVNVNLNNDTGAPPPSKNDSVGNDDRSCRTSPCSNRWKSALNLILIIETFSIGILILFIFKIEQFAKSIVLGCVKEVAV